jgi:hypothetical protein
MLPTNTNGEHPLWPFYTHERDIDMGTRKDGTSSTTWQGANDHNNLRRQDIHSQYSAKTWMLPTNTNEEHPLWPFYYYNRALDMGTRKDGTSSTTWQGANHHNNLRRQDIHSQ